jgi:hypothetical protein
MRIIALAICSLVLIPACRSISDDVGTPDQEQPTVAETPSAVQSVDGRYISWVEHRIDDEAINGGVPIRGGDGLKMADLDLDGYVDIVSVHEDSDHVRLAFGSEDPDVWGLVTLSSGPDVDAVEDVTVGDLNGDGWPDLVFACERGHLIYFQNPGKTARSGKWRSHIPRVTQGRGSWLRAFLADLDGDGQLEVLAANKGGVDIVDVKAGERASGPVSAFHIKGAPLEDEAWQEVPLFEHGPANNALPVDIDQDGNVDVLVADRQENRTFILRNTGEGAQLSMTPVEIKIVAPDGYPAGWKGMTNAFQASVLDLNQDGRTDIAVNVIERTPTSQSASFGWLVQPSSLSGEWGYHRIGDILPDWVTGFVFADIDDDGDQDVIVGGYSGLNILGGAYSGASRDHDDPAVTAADSTGRIAWFQNPGDPAGIWERRDISRRVRGMYDEFIPRDMDGDGDVDFVATRGNSGNYDGVFWLEQKRTDKAERAFTPARRQESKALPLPPDNWLELYTHAVTMQAPNEREEK